MRIGSSSNAYFMNPVLNDWQRVMQMSAPEGIPHMLWEQSNYEERLGLLEESINAHGSQISGTALGMAPVMLAESRKIFTEYPAHVSLQWEFSRSPVTGKGGPSEKLSTKLKESGILIEYDASKEIPQNLNTENNVSRGQLNNINGAEAEKAIAKEFTKQGYHVEQQFSIQTPLGERRIDIVATKNEGHPKNSKWHPYCGKSLWYCRRRCRWFCWCCKWHFSGRSRRFNHSRIWHSSRSRCRWFFTHNRNIIYGHRTFFKVVTRASRAHLPQTPFPLAEEGLGLKTTQTD